MAALAAKTGAALIMMCPVGGDGEDVLAVTRRWFEAALQRAAAAGLPLSRVCLDPGIGFGTTREEDARLLAGIGRLRDGLPPVTVLVGASRKRVTAAFSEQAPPAAERLAGTLAAHTIAQLGGAHILRVHDGAAAAEAR